MSRLLSLSLIAAFALVATACGANPTPSDDVTDAGTRTKAAGSVRVETVTRISLTSNGESQVYRVTGVVDYANDRSEYRNGSDGCREIMIGDVSYTEYSPLEDGFPAGKRWVRYQDEAADSEALYEQSQEQTRSDDGELRIHFYSVVGFAFQESEPHDYLDSLRDSAGEPERVGEEDVRGVSTTRYHFAIDVRSSARKMLEAKGWKAVNIERYLEDVESGVREIDVWVDADGLARRVVAADSSEGPDGAIAAEWLTTTEYFDFGLDAEIQTPLAAEVIDAETWQRAQEKAMTKWMDEHAMEDAEENEPLPGGWAPYVPDDLPQAPTCMP